MLRLSPCLLPALHVVSLASRRSRRALPASHPCTPGCSPAAHLLPIFKPPVHLLLTFCFTTPGGRQRLHHPRHLEDVGQGHVRSLWPCLLGRHRVRLQVAGLHRWCAACLSCFTLTVHANCDVAGRTETAGRRATYGCDGGAQQVDLHVTLASLHPASGPATTLPADCLPANLPLPCLPVCRRHSHWRGRS